jgi:hypothetical protein
MKTHEWSRSTNDVTGRWRSADMEYKIPGENGFRTTTHPKHKIIMVSSSCRRAGHGERRRRQKR